MIVHHPTALPALAKRQFLHLIEVPILFEGKSHYGGTYQTTVFVLDSTPTPFVRQLLKLTLRQNQGIDDNSDHICSSRILQTLARDVITYFRAKKTAFF